MPIYEYYCQTCTDTFTVLRPMSQADTLAACSRCDSLQTQRVLSLFAVHTTGSSPRAAAFPASGGGCACGGSCGCSH